MLEPDNPGAVIAAAPGLSGSMTFAQGNREPPGGLPNTARLLTLRAFGRRFWQGVVMFPYYQNRHGAMPRARAEPFQMNTQSHLETYQMLASFGCRFIKVLPRSKKPEGQSWTFITPEDAVKRLSEGGNVGVVPRNDVFMVDLDGKETIDRFIAECQQLPDYESFDTFAVKTPNGLHLYFRANEPEKIRIAVGNTYWGKGVDIRAPKNSQVVGPGSYVESTKPRKKSGWYSVCNKSDSLVPIALCPMAIEKKCRKREKVGTSPTTAEKARTTDSTAVPTASHTKPEQPAPYRQPEAVKPSLQACRNNVSRLLRKIIEAEPGARNDTIAKHAAVIGSYVAHYRDEFDAMETSPLDRLRSAVRKTFTDDDSEDERAKHLETAERQYEWGLDHPHVGDEGKSNETNEPEQFVNICALMERHARFNLANESEEWWFPNEKKWRPMKPHETSHLLTRVWNEHGWNIKAQDRKNLLTFVSLQHQVHPFQDFMLANIDFVDPELANIPIERSLHWWVVNPDGEYEQWCQRAIWGQPISRVMDDPIPLRTIVTLRGPARAGKSALVRHLLPEELGGVGLLDLSESRRDIIVLLNKQYAVEFPELAGASKKEVAFVKSLIGAGGMHIRRLHTTESMEIIYKSAIIGTANEEPTLFNDPALIDRFAYLDVRRNDEYDPAIWIPRIRKHYLAAALRAYMDGERYHVTPEHLVATQTEQAGQSVNRDQVMIDRIAQIDYPNLPKRCIISEIAQHAGLARNYSEYKRNRLHQSLPTVLRSLGFTSERGKGGMEWWERPEDYPPSEIDVKQDDKQCRNNLASKAFISRTSGIAGWKKDLTQLD